MCAVTLVSLMNEEHRVRISDSASIDVVSIAVGLASKVVLLIGFICRTKTGTADRRGESGNCY